MKDFQIIAWTLLLAEVVLLAVFLWLPVMGGARAFFGVRVAAETLRGDGATDGCGINRRRYRWRAIGWHYSGVVAQGAARRDLEYLGGAYLPPQSRSFVMPSIRVPTLR